MGAPQAQRREDDEGDDEGRRREDPRGRDLARDSEVDVGLVRAGDDRGADEGADHHGHEDGEDHPQPLDLAGAVGWGEVAHGGGDRGDAQHEAGHHDRARDDDGQHPAGREHGEQTHRVQGRHRKNGPRGSHPVERPAADDADDGCAYEHRRQHNGVTIDPQVALDVDDEERQEDLGAGAQHGPRHECGVEAWVGTDGAGTQSVDDGVEITAGWLWLTGLPESEPGHDADNGGDTDQTSQSEETKPGGKSQDEPKQSNVDANK